MRVSARGLATLALCAAATGMVSGCAERQVSALAVEQSVRDGMASKGVELRSVSCPEGLEAQVDATVICEVDFWDENALGQPVDRMRVVVIASSGEEVRYRLEPLAVGVPDDAEATS